MNKHIGLIGIDIAKIAPDQTVIFLSDGNQFWNLEPLKIDDLKDGAMILYANLVAAAFGVPMDTLLGEDGTYSYYKSILDEVDKRQTPWGRVMSDIAIQELTKEEDRGPEIK